MPPDQISIIGLDLPVQIGVPEEERAGWQSLRANVWMEVGGRFEAMGDDLARTINYEAVANALKRLAAERPRQLIETLAAEMAAEVLTRFHARQVTIELHKRVLPGVEHVGVRLTRAADSPPPCN